MANDEQKTPTLTIRKLSTADDLAAHPFGATACFGHPGRVMGAPAIGGSATPSADGAGRRHAPGATGSECMTVDDDPSWRHYAHTILVLGDDPRVALDLRTPMSDEARASLAAIGIARPFAVLTAANPFGRMADGRQNRRRHARLTAALSLRGISWVAADGVSPDGRHREAGVAVFTTQGVARALARQYGQSAFFWYDGADVWLLGAAVATEPRRLPGG